MLTFSIKRISRYGREIAQRNTLKVWDLTEKQVILGLSMAINGATGMLHTSTSIQIIREKDLIN
jgi:hypothetical protein